MKINNLLLSKRGFTLVELLLVVLITGSIATLGISTFASYARTQRFNQAVVDFVNTLNTAKSKAYAQSKPNVPQCNNSSLQSYRVRTNNPLRGYTLYAVCGNTEVNPRIVILPGSSYSITATMVEFRVLTGGIVGSGNIVISDGSSSKTINVSSVGVISIL